jgi:hypothetical protein
MASIQAYPTLFDLLQEGGLGPSIEEKVKGHNKVKAGLNAAPLGPTMID